MCLAVPGKVLDFRIAANLLPASDFATILANTNRHNDSPVFDMGTPVWAPYRPALLRRFVNVHLSSYSAPIWA